MEKQQLLDTLNALIGRYQQHRQYIDKARSQIGKFNSSVIEKVVQDHEIKAASVADEVVPLLPQIAAGVAALEGERNEIVASKGSLDEVIQELDLRLLIGELDEAGYEQEVADLRERQNSAANRLEGIDSDIAVYQRVLSAWEQLSGQTVARVEVPAPEPTLEPAPEPTPEPAAAPEPTPEPTPEPIDEFVAPAGTEATADIQAGTLQGDFVQAGNDEVGAHISVSKIQEDLGAVYQEPLKVSSSVEEDIAIETADVADPGADGGDIQFSLNDDGAEVAVDTSSPGESIGAGISLDSGDLGTDLNGIGEDVEIDFGADAAPAAEPATSQRRALLLYQEGTPDEQIYPFQNDQLTIGRGRENDIQIKNDSKVSRYHCRISRRGNNFYIEDVKSSNGTLVNGELVTERRLFGGEEVIIGETFFRFRIMD